MAVVITPRAESSRLITCVEGLNTLSSSSGTGVQMADNLGILFTDKATGGCGIPKSGGGPPYPPPARLMAANFRIVIVGVPGMGVPAVGVPGFDIVLVTMCMCSPKFFSPFLYILLRWRRLAK